MRDLLVFAVLFALLTVLNLYRLAAGPSSADRMIAADSADVLLCCAMILFSLYSGRGVYLDIAIISAMFGIIDTIVIGRYLERKGKVQHDDRSDSR